MSLKQPLIIIAGPTATGKTDTAVALAEIISGEIISADSMQIYKFMNIGTAKPSKEEMCGITHYLMDELYPDEEYSAAIFTEKAKSHINDIVSRGKIPILCGGTGFYINALLYDTEFCDTSADQTLRKELAEFAAANGNKALHNRLAAVDPEYALTVHENNVKRVIRALEYYTLTGTKFSFHNKVEKEKNMAYNASMVVLTRQRDKLYEGIDRRVGKMFSAGLAEEVENLFKMGYNANLVSMQGLGYKETAKYLSGEWTLEQATKAIKKGTRHFAKRQLTWFSGQGQKEDLWIDMDKINDGGKSWQRAAQIIKESYLTK